MKDANLSKHIKYTTLRANHNVNYRFGELMMCNVVSSVITNVLLVSDIDNGRGYACIGIGSI